MTFYSGHPSVLPQAATDTAWNNLPAPPELHCSEDVYKRQDAQKVQISINGETNRMFRESINFDTIFEKNEGLIEQ